MQHGQVSGVMLPRRRATRPGRVRRPTAAVAWCLLPHAGIAGRRCRIPAMLRWQVGAPIIRALKRRPSAKPQV